MFHDFVIAIRFLTILPLPSGRGSKTNELSRATAFFPLVGFLIGFISLVLYFIARPYLPGQTADLILLFAPIFLTGGLHVDGFTDFCDGFFGGEGKADILRIMKDPHTGVWGVLGIAALLLTKLEFLHHLPAKAGFFLFAMTASRWAQVVLSFFLPFAGRPGGLGEQVARKIGFRKAVAATFFLLPTFWLIPMEGIGVFASLLAFLFLLGIFFHKKIGGLTGDLLGATSELTECFIFVAATLIVKR